MVSIPHQFHGEQQYFVLQLPPSPLRHNLREGTLGIIGAIGENQGPLRVVRLENTTDAGLGFEAARQAELTVSARKRNQWVEVRAPTLTSSTLQTREKLSQQSGVSAAVYPN